MSVQTFSFICPHLPCYVRDIRSSSVSFGVVFLRLSSGYRFGFYFCAPRARVCFAKFHHTTRPAPLFLGCLAINGFPFSHSVAAEPAASRTAAVWFSLFASRFHHANTPVEPPCASAPRVINRAPHFLFTACFCLRAHLRVRLKL